MRNVFFIAAMCALLAGCTIGTPRDLARGHSYRPQNVFAGADTLPANMRRVAVLPLVCDESDYDLSESRAVLQPILLAELMKTKKFEVVSPDAAVLENRTRQAEWSDDQALPADLFTILRQTSACDAVLFTRLTVFRPYPPLAVGWRLRLVDAQSGKTIWSADEVFDGGQPDVQNGARRHQLTAERDSYGAPDEWFTRNSPSRFAEYTAARLFATLPAR